MKTPPHYFHEDGGNVVNTVGTLVELLRLRVRQPSPQAAYTFLAEGGNQALSLGYEELDRQARSIAAGLQDLGLEGERALLLYVPGLAYIAAFFGCLYAGVVAVPAYPPRNQRNLPRLKAVLDDSRAAIILSTAAVAGSSAVSAWQSEGGLKQRWLLTDALDLAAADAWQAPVLGEKSLAFLQYTSGSTGNAKGVMVSHGNLMANQKLIKARFGHDSESTVVGWLPLYHDMGLIGNIMQPLYSGAPVILMSPMAFLEQPLRWLQAISDYRAHTSGGPNFAYDLCVRKITDDDKTRLDLSSWRLAFNGAEPVQAATLDRFEQAFAGCGFRRAAFYPCYGLAEATLLVSGKTKNAEPTVKNFDKARLTEGVAEIALAAEGRRLVACGTPGSDHGIRITDPETQAVCENGRIGEIQVKGPSIAQGYWQNAVATAETFVADDGGALWLRTGDLGFIDDGELFVSGRIKDLIIVRGRNYYPHDLEAAAEAAAEAVNAGCSAAFSIVGEDGEQLVLLVELKRSHLRQGDYLPVFAAIRGRLADECGVQLDTVVLLKPGAILKTTSGKIRRNACREAYESGRLHPVAVDTLLEQHLPRSTRIEPNTAARALPPPEQALLRQALLSTPQAEGVQLLAQYLASKVAALSGLAVGQILAADGGAGQPIIGLGIDSLKAMELKHFIDDFLDIDLPVVLLLEERSLTEIAEQSLALAKSSRAAASVSAATRPTAEMPLSQGQQAIWTVCRIDRQTAVYNMPVALHIASEIAAAALRAALGDLLDRHEQLRTVFRLNEKTAVVQAVQPGSEAALECVRCRNEQERRQQLDAEITRPFSLEQGPLLRAGLFSIAADDHILLLCAHHIVVDFRSMTKLLAELKILYAARLSGQTTALPPLTSSYRDYIRWQQDYLHSPMAEQAECYWQERMSGELPKLELPTDASPLAPSYQGRAEMLAIEAHTVQKLRELAGRHGATLYMVLLGVFKVLLYRYSGQEDIIVGSPVLGRPRREFADTVGYFVNPVPLRTHPSGAKTFVAYLAEVRQTVLGALRHQDYPFSLLVEKLQPERDRGLSPFYRTWFVLQDGSAEDAAALALGLPGMSLDWPGLNAESAALTDGIAQFDLTLMMAESDQGLSAVLQYRSELFARETILRMLGHFQCLLHGILADPDARLSELPLLTVPELERQLLDWNQTRSPYPEELCLHQWFELQAARTPESTAVVFQEHALSYAELNNEANRLAHFLRARGGGPETRIAVCIERSPALPVALLAILKTGAAYVPIDPDYPAERQNYLLEDAGCRLLLTRSGLDTRFEGTQAEIIRVDRDAPLYADACPQSLPASLAVDNAAYLIYTSGSTGKPKGVVISHRNVVHSLWARFQYYPAPVGCYLLLSSFAFDSSVAGIFWTLSQGGCLCLPDDSQPKDPVALGILIEWRQVTHLLALPSLYAALLEHVPPSRLASLKTVIVAGEACPAGIAAQHYALLPDVRLYNEYGPTEATVWSTVHAVGAQEHGAVINIGGPVSNARTYILDRYLQPVPVGVFGELHIGGGGIARGYLNQPELSAEKFIPDPFGEDGGRLYKTGDWVRYRPDGRIDFSGRIDTQIKLRGYRIELGEIESHLRQHPAVKETAVMVREDLPGRQRLVAYLVARQDEPIDVAALKTLLEECLPAYMVPNTFVLLDALPLNANGKLDRKALPAPEHQGLAGKSFVAPRDEAEEAVAGIWREILGIDQLGIHDDFFELGGHSLSGVQVMARIQELFNLEVPVNILFEAPTVAEFVDKIADYQANEC